MKKKWPLIIIVFLILLSPCLAEAPLISGEAAVPFNLSLVVLNAGPQITIYKPNAGGIYRNETILLNYSLQDPEIVNWSWYHIDTGSNISLGSDVSGTTYFNTSEGSHILYLWANDSKSNISMANVSFIANNSLILIVTLIFPSDATSTTSTSHTFTCNTTDDIKLDNVTLFVWKSGALYYNNTTTISGTANSSSWSITSMPVDSYTWNCQAYNNNSQSSWATNNYSLTINSISLPTPPAVPRAFGGGMVSAAEFTLSKDLIDVSLKQGETKMESFGIKNIGSEAMKMTLDITGVDDFVKLSETEFVLAPGATRIIFVDFLARESTIPNLYMGKILVTGKGVTEYVLVTIEVESKEPLFDVKVNIPEKFKEILPGEEVVATTVIYNLGDKELVDVLVEYFVKDEDGNTLVTAEETIAIETQASLVKTVRIPVNAKFGRYIVYVKVTYLDKVASGSDFFWIIPFFFFRTDYLIMFAILISLFLMFILYKRRKKDKKRKRKKRIKRKSKKIL